MGRRKTKAATESKAARLNVRIDADAMKKLHIHATMASKNPGEIITELINAHLREWTVRRLADRPDGGGHPGDAAPPLKGL